MKDKVKHLVDTIALVCIPAMALFFLMLLCYMVFLKTGVVTNIYGQVICLYGIPIVISLCFLPMKLTSSTWEDIGLCHNRRAYQDFITVAGVTVLILLFFYKNRMDKMEGAYVLQFIFVGIGEEIFFRAILYHQIRNICRSDVIAMLSVAVIFGCLFHADGGFAALLFIRIPLSLLFSIIYKKTGSLIIPIILHGLYNILV